VAELFKPRGLKERPVLVNPIYNRINGFCSPAQIWQANLSEVRFAPWASDPLIFYVYRLYTKK